MGGFYNMLLKLTANLQINLMKVWREEIRNKYTSPPRYSWLLTMKSILEECWNILKKVLKNVEKKLYGSI